MPFPPFQNLLVGLTGRDEIAFTRPAREINNVGNYALFHGLFVVSDNFAMIASSARWIVSHFRLPFSSLCSLRVDQSVQSSDPRSDDHDLDHATCKIAMAVGWQCAERVIIPRRVASYTTNFYAMNMAGLRIRKEGMDGASAAAKTTCSYANNFLPRGTLRITTERLHNNA